MCHRLKNEESRVFGHVASPHKARPKPLLAPSSEAPHSVVDDVMSCHVMSCHVIPCHVIFVCLSTQATGNAASVSTPVAAAAAAASASASDTLRFVAAIFASAEKKTQAKHRKGWVRRLVRRVPERGPGRGG